MVTKRTGPRVGRRAKDCPPWDRPDFFKSCEKRYDAALVANAKRASQRQASSFSRARGLLSEATIFTGDPLFATDPIAAFKVYGLASAPRPSRALASTLEKIWGSEARSIAGYAATVERCEGRTRRNAIAEAVATCAERGTYILSGGRPVSFARALRAVYEAMPSTTAPYAYQSIGFIGRNLMVKPAVAGGRMHMAHCGGALMPAEGALVPDDQHWRRHLALGNVVLVP